MVNDSKGLFILLLNYVLYLAVYNAHCLPNF